jgi:hypothetical protein
MEPRPGAGDSISGGENESPFNRGAGEALEISNDQTAGLSDVTHHLLADSSGISFSAERQDLAMVLLRLRLIRPAQ